LFLWSKGRIDRCIPKGIFRLADNPPATPNDNRGGSPTACQRFAALRQGLSPPAKIRALSATNSMGANFCHRRSRVLVTVFVPLCLPVVTSGSQCPNLPHDSPIPPFDNGFFE
jgi:hypothetical protein